MNRLEKIARNAQKINTNFLMKWLFASREFRDTIIYLNTWDQLYDRGIDSEGKSLGHYQPYTVFLKELKGQPTDHITLRDTGDFYKSFRVTLSNLDIQIVCDPIKYGPLGVVNLLMQWGKEIIGLTDESMSILRDKAIQILRPLIKQKLLE